MEVAICLGADAHFYNVKARGSLNEGAVHSNRDALRPMYMCVIALPRFIATGRGRANETSEEHAEPK